MRKIITTLAITAIVLSCNTAKNATTEVTEVTATTPTSVATRTKIETPVTLAKPAKTMLLGKEDRSALEAAPFNTWFNTNYTNYTVKEDQVKDLKKGLKGVTVTTFMGTWCGDSKRETPRMYKILDATKYDQEDFTLITVDRTKQNPKEFTTGQNIVRVPTFIFKKDGKEIGRIVERPVESLEADMLKILNGESYKHAYEK